jgi:adenylate kinase
VHEPLPRKAWLDQPGHPCDPDPTARARPLRIVLLGAPGVGKGTQAELITARRRVCQLSTGDVFRAARRADPCDRTPALEDAVAYMQRGELVPDATVVDVVKERVACLRCDGGFLLDGFPRTVAQAEVLDVLLAAEGLCLDAVVSYDLPGERLVARLSGRRTCEDCKSVFHVEARPPARQGACDHCGGALRVREDDRPEAIRVRMRVYEESTAPLVGYYSARGLLLPVLAEGTPEEIYARTEAALDARRMTVRQRQSR